MHLKTHNAANLPLIDYRKLKPLQGNLKDLSKANFEKLKKSFTLKGFRVPFFVWLPTSNETVNVSGQSVEILANMPYLLDGHQRQRTLIEIGATPYELPYVRIEANNYRDAKETLLIITSQYGKMTQDGLDEFSFDLNTDFITDVVNFDALPYFLNEVNEGEDGKNEPLKSLTLKFNEAELEVVKQKLMNVAPTNEAAIKKLLNILTDE